MHVKVTTQVNQNLASVKAGFNQDLFLKLNPPFPTVSLIRFGGCYTGDFVELLLDFKVKKQKWISEITYDNETNERFEFIDEGVVLPFPFHSWKHHHILIGNAEGCQIVDSIEYKAKYKLMTVLLYPLLLLQFLYRKPVYKQVFK
jgi:ligand-binding SRPBCC domain-containing protein